MKQAVSIWALFALAVGLSAWQIGPGPPVPPVVLRSRSITLSAAQINAMFTTPVLLIPAQGPGTVVNVNRCVFNAVFGSGAFTGGGNIAVYFGATSPPTSPITGPGSAALLTTFSSNQFAAGNPATAVTTVAVNTGVYVSNLTGVFAGGAGSSMTVNCTYYVTPGMQ